MTLNHVCMWMEKGWRRITAEEATRLHPGGTVSAHSGLFMCEICGQYVLFTDRNIKCRHFRHSPSEKIKNCPERTNGSSVTYGYSAYEHELPIRISKISNCSFILEMGFIPIPRDLVSTKLKIMIKPDLHEMTNFTYKRDRLELDRITYLSIGNLPSERYNIEVSDADDRIYQFWPKYVQGIDSAGTVFDADTGKKLVYDADVVVGKKYYLLCKEPISARYDSHVECKKVCIQRISREIWYVYEVMANDYDEVAARFFLDYHCRLTEEPISIQPVWPIYVESPYVVKHNQKCIIMHLKGNAPTTRVFPKAMVIEHSCEDGLVLEIACNERQQLISAGRTNALQYMYFWKEPLSQTNERPVAKVTDLHDVPIEEGENHRLPDQRILRIVIPYDGFLVIKQDEYIIEKRRLSAETSIEIDDISWNTELVIGVGLDVVWKTCFHKEKTLQDYEDETAILHRLEGYGGPQMPIAHTLGSLASSLSTYPLIRRWLYKCIRAGNINRHAYKDLQNIIKSIKLNGQI